MITSSSQARLDGDVPVDDLALSGLPSPSIVRPIKIACVEPARILRQVGVLSHRNWHNVRQELHRLLAPAQG